MRTRTVALFSASAVVRRAIRDALARIPDLRLAIERDVGDDAAGIVARMSPDLVILDTWLPHADAYDIARAIVSRHPTPVLLLAEDPLDERQMSRASETGATHVTAPPRPRGLPPWDEEMQGFVELLRSLAAVGEEPRAGAPDAAPDGAQPVAVVGIVASAGGPQALVQLLVGQPRGVLPPLLLVQHLAPGFAGGFAEWIGRSTGYPTRIGTDGLRAEVGSAYLAPHESQMWMDRGGALVVRPPEPHERFRPSGDRLLAGLAAEHGPRAAGIVLSGMGDDGAAGASELRRAGGLVLVQADAPIDSMPSAVVAAGAADAVLPVASIAAWLARQRVPS